MLVIVSRPNLLFVQLYITRVKSPGVVLLIDFPPTNSWAIIHTHDYLFYDSVSFSLQLCAQKQQRHCTFPLFSYSQLICQLQMVKQKTMCTSISGMKVSTKAADGTYTKWETSHHLIIPLKTICFNSGLLSFENDLLLGQCWRLWCLLNQITKQTLGINIAC